MDALKNREFVIRAIAVIVVSLCITGYSMQTSAHLLWKMDHMSAVDYVAAQRHLLQQSFSHKFVVWLMYGLLFLGGTEFFASVLRLFTRTKPSA